jgi:hypothetical protein
MAEWCCVGGVYDLHDVYEEVLLHMKVFHRDPLLRDRFLGRELIVPLAVAGLVPVLRAVVF